MFKLEIAFLRNSVSIRNKDVNVLLTIIKTRFAVREYENISSKEAKSQTIGGQAPLMKSQAPLIGDVISIEPKAYKTGSCT
jgi:hypothetical protein